MTNYFLKGLSKILLLSMLSSSVSFADTKFESFNNFQQSSNKLEQNYKAHNSWRYSDEEKQTLLIRDYVRQTSNLIEEIGPNDKKQFLFTKSIGNIIINKSSNFTSYHFIKRFPKYDKLFGYDEIFEKRVIIDYNNDGIIDYMGVQIGTYEDFKNDKFPDLFELGIKLKNSNSLLKTVLDKIKELNLNDFVSNNGCAYIAIRDKGILDGIEEKLSFIELSKDSSYKEYKYDSHYNSLLKQLLFNLCEKIEEIKKN